MEVFKDAKVLRKTISDKERYNGLEILDLVVTEIKKNINIDGFAFMFTSSRGEEIV